MDILLVFAGAVVSVLVQIIKTEFGTTKPWTLSILIVLAVLASWGAWYLREKNLWETFLQIMSGAAILYAFFIKNLESKDSVIGEK